MKKPIKIWLCIAGLVSLALCETPGVSSASEDQKMPRLGQHTFAPNSLIREPFIQSYIRSRTGLANTSGVDVPTVVLPDSTVLANLNTNVTGALLNFEFQQAIKSWVAVRAQIEIVGRLGTSTEALLSEGINGVGSFELGWLFKLFQSERDALSLDLVMRRNKGSFINLLDWLDRILEDGGLEPDNELVLSRDSMQGVGRLSYAHGFSPLFGLLAGANLGYGENLQRNGTNEWSYQLGLGLNFNLHDTTKLPFGVLLGYTLSDASDLSRTLDGTVHQAALRIDYMGFEDFVVGLDLGSASYPVEGLSDRLVSSSFVFSLSYYY